MTWGEVARWIGSYNAWVEIWNRHERSRDLPLSPDWPEAEFVLAFGLPRSALVFRPRGDDRLGAIRVGGWRPYYPGWSHCRRSAAVERVKWAGWHR